MAGTTGGTETNGWDQPITVGKVVPWPHLRPEPSILAPEKHCERPNL